MPQLQDPVSSHHVRPAVPTGVAQTVRGKRAIRAAMMLLTGAAATLWILAQIEPSIAGRDWIWLLIIVTLTAWPSYGAWCSHQATSKRLADLEHRCATMYSTGYANGYLDALSAAPAEPATDQVSP